MPGKKETLTTGWQFHQGQTREGSYTPVTIPHDWAVNAPFNRSMEQGEAQGFRDRWGIGWYKRSLKLEEKRPNHCYYLDFGGIYENSTVWVNDIEVGGWHYGYSSFRLDITHAARAGENTILIKVDNTSFPVDRWYSGCGIYRSVKFLELPGRHIEERELTVHTKLEADRAVVTVDIGMTALVKGRMAAPQAAMRSNTEGNCVYFSAGRLVWEAESTDGKLTFLIDQPMLWSADAPNLYELTVSLMKPRIEQDNVLSGAGETVIGIDEAEESAAEEAEKAVAAGKDMIEEAVVEDCVTLRIGIRDINISAEQGMVVNGRPVKLKGVCLHQEAGSCGIAVRPEIWRERLLQLKELGCNAIRAAHHIFAEEFLDLCDELGFYVYEECFDKWTSGLYGRYFETDWQKDVETMVKRDRNRACIFIWGVGNEVEHQGQPSMLAILKMLCDHIRTMDTTRPVTYAMNPHFKRERQVDLSKIKDIQKFVDEVDEWEIEDPKERVERIRGIAEIVDVISCNYQEQWYELIHERIPGKPILGTEVYQLFMGHYDQMQNFSNKNPNLVPFGKDYCIGSMIWTGYDYLGESMGYPAKGWSGALLRTNLERRPGYYILQSYWSREPMVHFSVMDYSLEDEGVKEHWDSPIYADHWHFPQFHKTLIPYIIASNCDEVELYLNDKRFYIPGPSECPNRLITGFLPWQPGTVRVVGIQNGEAVCEQLTVTPGPAVRLLFDGPGEAVSASVLLPQKREAVSAGRSEAVFLPAQKGYEKLLTVRAADEGGHPCFRESALVRFRVEGPARILSVDNGNIMSNEPYEETFIHLYHGAASVRIAFTGEPGRVAVYADADGMYSGSCVLVTGG